VNSPFKIAADALHGTVTEIMQAHYGRTPDTVYEYAKRYPKGPVAFEKTFTKRFVRKVQPSTGSRRWWNFGRKHFDTFAQLSGMTVADVRAIATFSKNELQSYLKLKAMRKRDAHAWLGQLELAEQTPDLTFTDQDLFGEVMKAYFIATQLEQ
jgi:hypothetical protein